MGRCELCKRKAWVQCDADLAALCWDCDARVHSANFLVARHTRNLLCKLCESVLPWSADGSRLTPIVSICEHCVTGRNRDATEAVERGVVAEEEEIPVVPSSPPDSCSSSSSKHELRDGEVEDLRKRCSRGSSSPKQKKDDDFSKDLHKPENGEDRISVATTASKRGTTPSNRLLLL